MSNAQPGLVDWVLSHATYITWPYFGFGNVMARCILDHTEYSYMPDWNYWGSALAPLDIPGSAKPATCTAWSGGNYYTLAHFGTLISLRDGWTDLRTAVIEGLRGIKDENTQRWLAHQVKRDSRILIPVGGHLGANFVSQHTRQPIIALTWQNAALIDTRCVHDWSTAEHMTDHYHHFVTPRPHVLRVPIETFIYGDASSWFPLFGQICEAVHIKTPHPERARAFCLYWRERVDRFIAVDKKTYASNR